MPTKKKPHWRKDIDYMITGKKLSANNEYKFWAEKMGYTDVDLSQVDEVCWLFAEGESAFRVWLNSPLGHAPNYWHHHGFTDSRQMDLVLSINFQKICDFASRE